MPKSSCGGGKKKKEKPLTKCFLEFKDKSHKGRTVSCLPAKAKQKLHREPLIQVRSDSLVLASFNFCGVPCSFHRSNLKRKLKCSLKHSRGVLAALRLLNPANLFSNLTSGRLACISSVSAESLLPQLLLLMMPNEILNHLSCPKHKSCSSAGFCCPSLLLVEFNFLVFALLVLIYFLSSQSCLWLAGCHLPCPTHRPALPEHAPHCFCCLPLQLLGTHRILVSACADCVQVIFVFLCPFFFS